MSTFEEDDDIGGMSGTEEGGLGTDDDDVLGGLGSEGGGDVPAGELGDDEPETDDQGW